MYSEISVNNIKFSTHVQKSNKSRFSETFHDVFQRALNNKSRPPKLEITGLLIPCYQEHLCQIFRFKLGTDSTEYLLSMSPKLAQAAKKATWEEVTATGLLDLESNVFTVEKLRLKQAEDPIEIHPTFREPSEIDTYTRLINQRGKLETSFEYLAS